MTDLPDGYREETDAQGRLRLIRCENGDHYSVALWNPNRDYFALPGGASDTTHAHAVAVWLLRRL